MCQTCYDRGYNDYPEYSGSSIEHNIDYIEGFKQKQYEFAGSQEHEDTNFCQKCYENGVFNARIGIWAPPTTVSTGHYQSYEKGYYQQSENDGLKDNETSLYNDIQPENETFIAEDSIITNNVQSNPTTLIYNKIKEQKILIISIIGFIVLVTASFVFIVKNPEKGKALISLFNKNKENEIIQTADSVNGNNQNNSIDTSNTIKAKPIETTDPHVIQPKAKPIETTDPHVIQPKAKPIETTDPHVIQPKAKPIVTTDPHVIQPKIKQVAPSTKPNLTNKEVKIHPATQGVQQKNNIIKPISVPVKTITTANKVAPKTDLVKNTTANVISKVGNSAKSTTSIINEKKQVTSVRKEKQDSVNKPYIIAKSSKIESINNLAIKQNSNKINQNINSDQAAKQLEKGNKKEISQAVTKARLSKNSKLDMVENVRPFNVTKEDKKEVKKIIVINHSAKSNKINMVENKRPFNPKKENKANKNTIVRYSLGANKDKLKIVENKHPFKSKKELDDLKPKTPDKKIATNVLESKTVVNNDLDSTDTEDSTDVNDSNTAIKVAESNKILHNRYSMPRVQKYYTFRQESESANDEHDKEPYGGKYRIASLRYLNENDIAKLNKESLKMMMNEIYARHNYRFKDKQLIIYFSDKYWYSAELDDVNALLTELEKTNIQLIKKHID